MNLQYITDNQGSPTGVFIPISDWNLLLKKYKNLETDFNDIPNWHKELVNKRIEENENNSVEPLDFYKAIEKIENEL
jgi:hypothetical protein